MACVVLGCKAHSSRKENADGSLSFHRFPKDEVLRKKWISHTRPHWTPTPYSRICSRHFTANSYILQAHENGRRLKDNAVPTLNLPEPEELMEPVSHISQETMAPNQRSTARQEQCNHEKELAQLKVKVKILENQLSRAKLINQRRLRKINTLTKRITRSHNRCEHLHYILMSKFKEENIEFHSLDY